MTSRTKDKEYEGHINTGSGICSISLIGIAHILAGQGFEWWIPGRESRLNPRICLPFAFSNLSPLKPGPAGTSNPVG